MGGKGKTFKIWILVLVLLIGLTFAGCEGTESREAVDDTVEELSGKKHVERFNKMKEDIEESAEKQGERLKGVE